MSNNDLTWNEDDSVAALKEGWRLVTVVDEGSTRPYWSVAAGTTPGDDAAAVRHVIEQAKHGRPLHQRALKISIHSRLRPAPARKKA